MATEAASGLKRATATVDCPKSMVGRVIGKSGETIKALQTYTGALIQIDQTVEPTKVTISGTPHSLSLAVSMVTDIVKGTFKGFALLRQITNPGGGGVVPQPPMLAPPRVPGPGAPLGNPMAHPRPVYAPGYGLIPPSQVSRARVARGGQLAHAQISYRLERRLAAPGRPRRHTLATWGRRGCARVRPGR
jgi:rRNA processing protein Krr1/Pno1